jgi:hypothetical protein
MAQVAVGEGVRGTLEEDDDGVELAEGANARVVDVVVDVLCGNVEVGDGIDAVEEGDSVPGRIEALEGRRILGGRVLAFLLGDTLEGSVGLPSSSQFNQVCDKEMGGDKEVKQQAGDDIGTAVIVAANTDQDAVLLQVHYH